VKGYSQPIQECRCVLRSNRRGGRGEEQDEQDGPVVCNTEARSGEPDRSQSFRTLIQLGRFIYLSTYQFISLPSLYPEDRV
jgi:hypothetical protein